MPRTTLSRIALALAPLALLAAVPAGAQTFTRTDYPDSGAGAQRAFVADLNGDGRMDVVLSGTSQRIAVMLNQGGGVFNGPTLILGTFFGLDAEAGDVNGDGKPDLVSIDGARMYVAIGNGSGGFTPGVNQLISSPANPRRLHLLDVNGDGKLDVVAAGFFAIFTALGNGNGTFQASQRFDVQGSTYDFKMTDLNNDGFPDVVLALGEDNRLQLMLNDRTGRFGSSAVYGYIFPRTVAAGDFNQDGNVDVVIGTSPGANQKVSIRLGNGDGTLRADTVLANFDPWSMASGQISGDNNLDVVVAGSIRVNNVSVNSVLVLEGDGTGGFASVAALAVNNISEGVAIARLNGDSLNDIVNPGYHPAGGTSTFCIACRRSRSRMPVPIRTSPPIRSASPPSNSTVQDRSSLMGGR